MTNHIPASGNSIIVGSTRTGKTTFIIDSLKRSNPRGSLVVFDRQGEYYQALAGHRAQHARLLDLRGLDIARDFPSNASPDCFNPLDLVRRDENLPHDVHGLVTAIFESTGRSEREYFNAKAIELLSGVIGYVLCVPRDGDRAPNLTDIYDFFSQPVEVFEELVEVMRGQRDIAFGVGAQAAAIFLFAEGNERAAIYATAARALGFLKIPAVRTALSESTFDVEEILDGRSDLFAIIPASLHFAPTIVGLITSIVAARAYALNTQRCEAGPAVTIVFDKIEANRGLDAVLREFRCGGPQISIVASGHTFAEFEEVFGSDASRSMAENAHRVYFSRRQSPVAHLQEDTKRLRQMSSREFLAYD